MFPSSANDSSPQYYLLILVFKKKSPDQSDLLCFHIMLKSWGNTFTFISSKSQNTFIQLIFANSLDRILAYWFLLFQKVHELSFDMILGFKLLHKFNNFIKRLIFNFLRYYLFFSWVDKDKVLALRSDNKSRRHKSFNWNL